MVADQLVANHTAKIASSITNVSAAPRQGIRPLVVTFTSQIGTKPDGDPTVSTLWNFGDGHMATEPNPAHVYDAAGVFTVTLRASNAAGSHTVTQTKAITVYAPAQAGFHAAGGAGGQVVFGDGLFEWNARRVAHEGVGVQVGRDLIVPIHWLRVRRLIVAVHVHDEDALATRMGGASGGEHDVVAIG